MHDWIPLVLEDIRTHAAQKGLSALAEQLSMSIAVARADIALAGDRPAETRPAATLPPDAGASPRAAILPFFRPAEQAATPSADDPGPPALTEAAARD